MFFSRVTIKLCEESLKYIDGLAKNDSYATHQLLWNLFPQDPSAERDFLYRAEQKEGWPVYYVVSKREPVITSNLFRINKKVYEPVISEDQQLKFNVRANPVVARKVNGKKNGVRHDVIMDAKIKAKLEELTEADTVKLKREYITKWLLDRAAQAGFSIDVATLRIDAYRQHRALKMSAKPLLYSTVDYGGILTVTNAEKFQKTLFNGLGRAKAFGCGLLLIKPCNR